MRAELLWPVPQRIACLAILLLVAGAFSCSVELPTSTPDSADPAACLLHAREAMDAGDATGALRWAELGIAADPTERWPELREEAARAAFCLGGGSFPNLIDAAVWVLRGGLAGSSPPEVPRWPAEVEPDPNGIEIDEAEAELLKRLKWRFIERAANHLDSLTLSLEQHRIPLDRLQDRLVGVYLSHSALRLATGLVLLLDANGDLRDGLQNGLEVDGDGRSEAPALDSLLAKGEEKVLDDLHRSLLSAENLKRVREGKIPLDQQESSEGDPLDLSIPLDVYVEAVRSVVAWIDEATDGSGGKGSEDHESEPHGWSAHILPPLTRLFESLFPAARAEVLPIRGSLHAPVVESLASGGCGYQPAGAPPDEGLRLDGGEVAWSEGTFSSLDAILDAKGLLEDAEDAPLADQLEAAGEASRLLEHRVAIVSFLPVRVGYRIGRFDMAIAAVADGIARSSTGTLGAPEGEGIERYGCNGYLAVREDRLVGRSMALGIALQMQTRWSARTNLTILPEPEVDRTGTVYGSWYDLRIGLASNPFPSRVQWGVVIDLPLEGNDGARDRDRLWSRSVHASAATRLRGFDLGMTRCFALLDGSIDASYAYGRAGLEFQHRRARLLLLRAEPGWEGEIRYASLFLATQMQRTPAQRSFRTYRIGVSR